MSLRVVRSILRTLTLTWSPVLTRSSTLEIRPQLISPMGKQPVDAADIDEGAEALDRADDSIVHLAFLERRPGALAQLGPFLLEQLAARDDEVLLALIGLGDEGLELLIDVGRGILDPRQVDLADRQEAADAVDVDFEAALDGLGHPGFDDHALSEGFPVGVDGRAFAPEQLNAFFRIEAVDDHLDRRTRQRQVALELVDGEHALALASQVDEDALAAHADDLAGAQARAAFLASLVGRQRAADRLGRDRGETSPDGCGVEPGQGGLELGFETASHCRLSGRSRFSTGRPAPRPVISPSAASIAASDADRFLADRGGARSAGSLAQAD